MRPTLLILGGTTEATALARRVAERGLTATLSLAGRVDRPLRQPLPQRIGGFGGIEGLSRHLEAEGITHLIDATHPFASQMSRNALAACAEVGVRHCVLTRPAWRPEPGDDWHCVPDIAGAVRALDRPRLRVMLAVGRMHLAAFAPNPQHRYLLRLVDPPKEPLPFPEAHVIVDRGPFDLEADRDLMLAQEIEVVVSKNSGGHGAYAKIAAARALGLPVIMIERPAQPEARTFHDSEAVLDWIAHDAAHLGV